MRSSITSFVNFLFDRLEQLSNWNKRSNLPEFDLYEREKLKGNFNNLISNLVKIIAAIILGYLIPSFLFPENNSNNFKINFNDNSIPLAILLWLFIGGIFTHCVFKIIKFSYKISINQTSFLLFLTSSYQVLKNKNLISFKVYKDFEILNLIILLSWIIIFTSILNYYWPKYGKVKNTYIEDNPQEEDDLLNETEKKLLDKIKIPLLKDKYKYSFSIGIIGPWGWGKSSFINRLKAEINNYSETYDPENQKVFYPSTPNNHTLGKQQIVTIEYSPFLNHSEENLIDDFFIQLSNKLGNYSNGLSKRVNKYAESLIEASENSIIKTIHQIVTVNFNQEASTDIYNEISEELTKLDIKVIVYIDDLDRLNPNEILQVLKLIRNTSNFPNFVFIVALDKEYVIRALNDLGDFTNRNFIDKFFQLECFLPEIEASDIINKTIQFIDEKNLIIEKDELFYAIRNYLFIFTEYVQNFRDVKKFVNQLHFEYNNVSNIFDEISIPDYLNLMLLKMKFPDYYRFILNNHETYFENKNGILSLKKSTKDQTPTEELIFNIQQVQDNRYIRPDVNEYTFYGNLNCEEEKKRYTCHEIDLIKRTLILLFTGDNNPVPKSIRRIPNLRKISYLRVAKSDFTNKEFNTLFNYYKQLSELDLASRSLTNIKNVSEDGKLEQLITQLSFIYPDDSVTIKAILLLTFDIIRVIKTQHLLYPKTQEILEKYYNPKQAFNKKIDWSNLIFSDELKLLFKENFVSAHEIDILEKLELLNYIFHQKHYTEELWQFKEDELQSMQVDLVKEETLKYKDNWEPNDRKIFSCYYLIYDRLNDSLKTELNEIIKHFFIEKEFSILFFNLLNPEYESHLAYKLNNIILYVFETIYNFIEFIESNYKNELAKNSEINQFLKLNSIVNNKRYLKFNFSPDVLIGDFQAWSPPPSEIAKEEMKNTIQLFFESNLSTSGFNFSSISARHNSYVYSFDGNDYWLFVSNNIQTSKEDFIKQILNAFILNFESKHNLVCTIEIDPKNNYPYLLDQNKKTSFKMISDQ